jgi:hypothetical protein
MREVSAEVTGSSSNEPLPQDDPQQRCPDISKGSGCSAESQLSICALACKCPWITSGRLFTGSARHSANQQPRRPNPISANIVPRYTRVHSRASRAFCIVACRAASWAVSGPFLEVISPDGMSLGSRTFLDRHAHALILKSQSYHLASI